MAGRTYKTFGEFLRKLRSRRDLSLKETAALSEKVSPDSSGALSHPYLSQLESGRRIAVSFAKIASLAAIYDVPVDKIIAQAPEPERVRLKRTLAEWRAVPRPFPKPLHRLPHAVDEVDRVLDGLLEQTAENVSLPLGNQTAARAAIRDGLMWATIVPYFERLSNRQKRAAEFWARASDELRGELKSAETPEIAATSWHRIMAEVRAWFIYELSCGPALLALIRSWTINFSRGGLWTYCGLLACRFRDDAIQQNYGFASVPVNAVCSVRSRQFAIALHAATSASDPRRLPPPPIEHAALDCLAVLIDPPASVPGMEFGSPIDVGAAIRQVCERVPLLSRPSPPDPVAAGLADFLNQALASPSAAPAATS